MKWLLTKQAGKLVPGDEDTWQAIARIKDGTEMWAEVKKAINAKFRAKYWVLVKLVWDNIDHERYENSIDALHCSIKVRAGHCYTVIRSDGITEYHAKSIAWEKMKDDAEFEAFFSNVCDVIARVFLPGVTSEQLRAEVEELIGARVAA